MKDIWYFETLNDGPGFRKEIEHYMPVASFIMIFRSQENVLLSFCQTLMSNSTGWNN